MKNVVDDVNLSKNEYFDSIISDYEDMKRYLAKRGEIELVKLYRYVLKRAKVLSVDKDKNADMISYCWLASMELEHTEAIQKYLRGEITQDDIDEYNAQKEIEIEQIVELLEQRKKERRSMLKQFTGMFKRHR